MAKRELKVVTPGEEPAAEAGEGIAEETAVDPNSLDAAELAPKPAPVAAATAARAAIPDQADVDPSTIPYGKTVFTKQGHVCSTAPDPKRK